MLPARKYRIRSGLQPGYYRNISELNRLRIDFAPGIYWSGNTGKNHTKFIPVPFPQDPQFFSNIVLPDCLSAQSA